MAGILSVCVYSVETSSLLNGDKPDEVDIELLQLLVVSSAALGQGVGRQTRSQASGLRGCVECAAGVGVKLIFPSVPLDASGVWRLGAWGYGRVKAPGP